MKIKTVLISVVMTGALVAGIGYGAYYSIMQTQNKPVNVVPVANVNFNSWGNTETTSGMVVSMDSQYVQLNTEYELVKVYVETGDQVKIGDPLLEYDMTLQELRREMEDLTRQTLELNLESLNRELKKLENTRATASLELTDTGILTASALEEGSGGADALPAAEPVSNDGSGVPAAEETSGNTPSVQDTGAAASETPAAERTGGETQSLPDEGVMEGEDPAGPDMGGDGGGSGSETTDTDDSQSGEDALIQDETDSAGGEETFSEKDDLIIDEENGYFDTDNPIDAEQVIGNVNAFLTRVNQVSVQDLDALIRSDIEEALRIYQTELADFEEEEKYDVFGEKRQLRIYTLKPAIAALVGDSTAAILQKAYDRICVYHFIYCTKQISLEGQKADEMDELTLRERKDAIRAAADAYYGLQASAWAEKEYEETLVSYSELLGTFVARLNYIDTMEETEPSTEIESESEFNDWGDGFGGFDGDDGMSYTAEELKEAIRLQKNDIAECELQIRESELKLKQYDRALDKKIIRSTMNGVVKSAGTLEDSVVDEAFITIAGASGLYVKGTVSETKLDTVHVGDFVQGFSYDTGLSFTAQITEISQYPSENDDYYGYGYGNANASNYPFLAYIEDTEGLSEGYVELQIMDSTPTTGIYLEKYLIRTESSGKSYVYIKGNDGLLKKQYVKTGKSLYGMALEIREGITMEDMIAFPYGKNVVEGAETKDAESLEDSSGYYG